MTKYKIEEFVEWLKTKEGADFEACLEWIIPFVPKVYSVEIKEDRKFPFIRAESLINQVLRIWIDEVDKQEEQKKKSWLTKTNYKN